MFEIENQEIESVNSGDTQAASPEPQDTGSGGTSQQESQTASGGEVPKSQPDTQPFHEHPRFKELVDQKNKAYEQSREFERQIQNLRSELDKIRQPTQKAVDPLISRLKEIDPEFGNRIEELDATKKQLAELREWKQQQDTQRLREQALNTVRDLHTKNKVSDDLRPIYDAQLKVMAQENPNMRMEDIPTAYAKIHESFTKYLEGVKRSERESYVKDKKTDAGVPSSVSKGTAAKPSNGMEWSKDPAEARSQLVKSIVKQVRASNES